MADNDAKTLVELITKVQEAIPLLEDKVEDLLRRHPDLFTFETDVEGKQTVGNYQLGRIVAICILDFLCWAYDRPDLGYIPPSAQDRGL
jgi:hypothetical protein